MRALPSSACHSAQQPQRAGTPGGSQADAHNDKAASPTTACDPSGKPDPAGTVAGTSRQGPDAHGTVRRPRTLEFPPCVQMEPQQRPSVFCSSEATQFSGCLSQAPFLAPTMFRINGTTLEQSFNHRRHCRVSFSTLSKTQNLLPRSDVTITNTFFF